MTVGEMERATRLAGFIAERLKHDLIWDMKELDSIEGNLGELENEMQRARSSATLQRAQRLRTQVERLANSRERVVEEESVSGSRLTSAQNVYYEEKDEAASYPLRMQADVMTASR